MAAASNKKVLVVRFDRESVEGFVQTPSGLEGDGVELLRPDGSLMLIPFSETKLVFFVRDFEAGESWRDDWQKHRAFASRPKTAGLWVRFRLRDGEQLEGILSNNLLQIEPAGFTAVPAGPTHQNQRVFVPRLALSSVEVLGAIGAAARKLPAKKAQEDKQLTMF